MNADRAIEFAPPHERLSPGAVGLAVAAHLALLAALTWGVSWKQQADIPTVEAELWSALPRQAAPAAVEPPPPPSPAPAPEPKPAPAPPPPPPKPDAQAERDAEIAVERAKKQRETEQQRAKLEEQRKEKEREAAKREADAKKRKEREAREEAERKEAATEKAEALKKQQVADGKKRAEAAAEAKRADALRQENIKRALGQAGATGGPTANGDAQRSSGPSGSYGGRVAAKVKPNIVFTDDIAGNPVAEVEVRAAPDGTITGVRLTKSSGNRGWDDAVVRALQKTETLPRDTDGRVPSPLVIGFRPRDVGL